MLKFLNARRMPLVAGLVLTLVSGFLMVGLAAPPAGATERPSWCHTGSYRSACAVLNNETQGFAPGSLSPNVENGFNLDYTGFQEGDCGNCANYVSTPVIPPQSRGGANIANVSADLSGAIGTVHFSGDSKYFGTSNGALTFWLSVPLSGSNAADCRTYLAEYLSCTYQWPPREEGVSKDAWWTWNVVDRPYVVVIRNYVTGQLVQVPGSFSLTNGIDSIPGTHTLATIPAATPVVDSTGIDAGSSPGESADTGLLTMNKDKATTMKVEYRFTSGPRAGTTITINIHIPQKGTATTDEGKEGNQSVGSFCNVGQSSTSGSLTCSVDRFEAVEQGTNRIVVTVS